MWDPLIRLFHWATVTICLLTTWDAFWGENWLEELHSTIATTLLTALGVHAAIVILTDRLTRSDLLRAMIQKPVPTDARVENPRND